MTDDIHSCSYYCDRPECIKRQRDELREKLSCEESLVREWHDRYTTEVMASQRISDAFDKMNRDRDAWRKLVVEHNAACTQLCRSGNVECRVTDSYSGCVTCPELYQIDIPPELEQP